MENKTHATRSWAVAFDLVQKAKGLVESYQHGTPSSFWDRVRDINEAAYHAVEHENDFSYVEVTGEAALAAEAYRRKSATPIDTFLDEVTALASEANRRRKAAP